MNDLKQMRLHKMVLIFLAAMGGWMARCPGVVTPEGGEADTILLDEDSTSEFVVSTWTTSEGLPVNDILDLIQTPDGYLWMGSHQGLVRFDGIRFQSFLTTPTGLRYGARIGPFELDQRGKLWLAPDQSGLLRLDDGQFTEVLTNRNVLKTRVVSLCNDGTNGMMWVDANGGLGRFSTEAPDQAEVMKGSASGTSQWMRDFEGNLWLTSLRSLKLYENKMWRNVPVRGSANLVATPRREGGLWVAREAKLRYVTTNGVSHEVATFPWIGQSRVECMLEDSHNRLWIGTLGQGLFCYADGRFKQVAPVTTGINGLLEDRQENLWASTRGGGLMRVRQRQFFMHDISRGLKNKFVRSLAQDKAGRVWLLTDDRGLSWWQNGSWHEPGEDEGWPGVNALSVTPADDGGVWISTLRHGIWRYQNERFVRQLLKNNPLKESAVDLLEDRARRLWMVTDSLGVFCLETNSVTNYTTREGLPSNYIRAIIEDDAGHLWAGDWQGGISRWRDSRWEIVRKASGHADAVRCMVATDEALWIGTGASGLLRFKNGQTTRISVEQGLPDVCIQQLLLDGQGSLWGGTPHRLFRLPIQQLNAVMDGRQSKIEPITYGRSDGLPDLSFAAWCDPRCWRTTDGELWFATANGAIHFQPGKLNESNPPQVLLEQTLLNGKPVTPAALQQLRTGVGRLEFRFTAPCLTAPERVRFRYQLSGVDSDWVDAESVRTATYGSLPPGKHIFRVLASSPEGIWNTEPAVLGLVVHPFFWETNWFLALVACAFAGGGVWFVRRTTVRRLNLRLERLRQQHAVDKERARIAQDIHDELGANLTSIGLLADMGARYKGDSSMVGRELKQISLTARESVAAMDSIVWALNPRNDSLDHFANYVSQFTRDFFRPTQLRTRLDLPVDLPSHPMSTETRHQLFLIVKESFNNIVRHAEATEVNVALACENGHLRLTIADDGKGISDKTVSEGQNGLINLRERIERIGGTLCIHSQNGRGATLEFILPLTKFGTN